MKVLKISNVPEVKYQVRHWMKWYWILEDGRVVKIDKVFKQAEEL